MSGFSRQTKSLNSDRVYIGHAELAEKLKPRLPASPELKRGGPVVKETLRKDGVF